MARELKEREMELLRLKKKKLEMEMEMEMKAIQQAKTKVSHCFFVGS